jgi:hypothetical protein
MATPANQSHPKRVKKTFTRDGKKFIVRPDGTSYQEGTLDKLNQAQKKILRERIRGDRDLIIRHKPVKPLYAAELNRIPNADGSVGLLPGRMVGVGHINTQLKHMDDFIWPTGRSTGDMGNFCGFDKGTSMPGPHALTITHALPRPGGIKGERPATQQPTMSNPTPHHPSAKTPLPSSQGPANPVPARPQGMPLPQRSKDTISPVRLGLLMNQVFSELSAAGLEDTLSDDEIYQYVNNGLRPKGHPGDLTRAQIDEMYREIFETDAPWVRRRVDRLLEKRAVPVAVVNLLGRLANVVSMQQSVVRTLAQKADELEPLGEATNGTLRVVDNEVKAVLADVVTLSKNPH